MNSTRRIVAVFAILMGSLLLGTWALLFLRGVADYGTNTAELGFLLVAEGLTGSSLVVGGVSTALGRRWGVPTLLVALGALLYCTIGVFAGRDNLPAAAWFVLVSLFTAAASVLLVRDAAGETSPRQSAPAAATSHVI